MNSYIPEKLFNPLGKVVANFNILEVLLDFTIWLLLFGNSSKEQKTGQIVTAELSFKEKIALLSSLYQHRFPDKKPFETLNNMRKKLGKANSKRNCLLHSAYLPSGRRVATRAKEKAGLIFESENMSVEKIEKTADFISEVTSDIVSFMGKFDKS